ncbi:MAG: aquaporin [Tabrizicola sp.]|uniref:aquaporin n=1 Tax=Tabrizicola sp. TaxID=2005166 RepID=UPI0027376A6D|nr:aquaporin [Tabrizicola sp.]MDP3263207.1 aquaporin [Tabrizicola sp.]
MQKRLLAEAPGTAIPVLSGCGTAVLTGSEVGMPGISLAFGLAVVAATCGSGAISGAQLNPAASPGMVTAGRMSVAEFAGYGAAQVAGAIVGAGVLVSSRRAPRARRRLPPALAQTAMDPAIWGNKRAAPLLGGHLAGAAHRAGETHAD